jgi:tetratricopeptide (TPR) repeat protein
VLAIAAFAMTFQNVQRSKVPEDCERGGDALEATDYNLAIEHYLLCLDTVGLPTDVLAQAYHGLAIAYTAKGNHQQAIKDYSEAIRLSPNNAWAYNNRCWSYGQLRRAEEALQDCDTALRLLPDRPEILDSRALAHWLLADNDKARQDLERAHKLDQSSPTWEERFREFEKMF